MSEDHQDIDQHLADLDAKETALTADAQFRSAVRVATEIRRTAKAERRLTAYIGGTFTLMNTAGSLLEPELGRDAAVEMIGLLESEERARAIQPDLPEDEYEQRVQWWSSCAYDNLAKAVAAMNGYNSDGMHACIADGIQVCRRTGKLQCITCFREYAADVYRAADDLEMAVHFARGGIAHDKPGPHDRRWAGAKDLYRALVELGRLAEAADAAELTWSLAATWHSPRTARLQGRLIVREAAHLLGEPDRWNRLFQGVPDELPVPAGEYPWLEMRREQVEAVVACMAGEFERAIAGLTDWDRRLTRNRSLDDWFDNRLRLLAAHRMAGNRAEFERLADQLEAKARPARDWLTLRCLERLRDPNTTMGPVPMTAEADRGPFAPKVRAAAAGATAGATAGAAATSEAAASAATASAAAASAAATSAAASESTPAGEAGSIRDRADDQAAAGAPTDAPLGTPVEAVDDTPDYWRRYVALRSDDELDDEGREAGIAAIRDELLAIDPAAERSAEAARWLLFAVRYVRGPQPREAEIWDWASRVAQPHQQNARVLSLLATLGAALQFGRDDSTTEIVPEEQIEKLFRRSLDLDPNRCANFERAGDYYLFQENLGEAERCFARAHRLDRGYADAAKKLAAVYRRTDREREGLAVLDICLREGSDDPELAWQAGLAANGLGRHEATLTYFDAYERLAPGEGWVNYYRALALLELARFDEAAAAAALEAERSPEFPFGPAVLRAAAAAGQRNVDEFRTRLEGVLAIRFAEIDYLTFTGLCKLATVLWKATAQVLPADDPLRRRLDDRLLATGTAPNELFEAAREGVEQIEGVNFYECVVRQPLDASWQDWHGRLAAEADFQAYTVTWGVLAVSEDAAAATVLGWQSRAYPLPAEVVSINMQNDGYRDRPGAVWQGFREGEGEGE